MFVVSFVCCAGRGLCDELITHPEESYRLWCVVCDLVASRMRRPWLALGRSATGGKRPWRSIGRIEVYVYSFFTFGARWWWAFNATLRPLYPLERDAVTIVHKSGSVPGPFWTGAENLVFTGIRSLGRPAHSVVGIGVTVAGTSLRARCLSKECRKAVGCRGWVTHLLNSWRITVVCHALCAGPYLGILRPWAQQNFAPPLFVRIQLCVSRNNTKKLTKDKTL